MQRPQPLPSRPGAKYSYAFLYCQEGAYGIEAACSCKRDIPVPFGPIVRLTDLSLSPPCLPEPAWCPAHTLAAESQVEASATLLAPKPQPQGPDSWPGLARAMGEIPSCHRPQHAPGVGPLLHRDPPGLPAEAPLQPWEEPQFWLWKVTLHVATIGPVVSSVSFSWEPQTRTAFKSKMPPCWQAGPRGLPGRALKPALRSVSDKAGWLLYACGRGHKQQEGPARVGASPVAAGGRCTLHTQGAHKGTSSILL